MTMDRGKDSSFYQYRHRHRHSHHDSRQPLSMTYVKKLLPVDVVFRSRSLRRTLWPLNEYRTGQDRL